MSILTPKEKNKRSKHLAPGYTTTNLLQSEEAMDRVMLKLMWWMDSYAESQKPMDLDKFFSYAAFDVVGLYLPISLLLSNILTRRRRGLVLEAIWFY